MLQETARGGDGWEGRVRLPASSASVPQDEEWFELRDGASWKRVRFHDYAAIYQQDGLYEHLFYRLLSCDSPRRVVGLLNEVRLDAANPSPPLRALDLGAGNGIVAEALAQIGAEQVIGLDILPEARSAALRDRPSLYADYLVADLCEPPPEVMTRLRGFEANALVCVAALGFGDIPAAAFHRAASLVSTGGLLAFNIKEDFLDERYTHGFSELIRRMVRGKVARVEAMRRYCHRLSAAGTPLFYTAFVVTKLADIPRSMLVDP
ncbi:MAG: class I SAM-dependent methyltransferase [Polyangiaceae bacterium]|nr:class I SAM-dependent methyltransferase [Polyangiaceae bacterium]